MRAREAGHAWARANIKPGMTELDVYCGVNAACIQRGRPGGHRLRRFRRLAGPGAPRRPADRAASSKPGDMFILDFSVVIDGYRSDFTNTLVVGREPTADQQRLYDLCLGAMAAGEKELRAGRHCLHGLRGGARRVRAGRRGGAFPAPRRPRPGPDAPGGAVPRPRTPTRRCWPATW